MKKILTLVLFVVTTNMAFAEDANEVQTTPSYSYMGISTGVINIDDDEGFVDLGMTSIYSSIEAGNNFHAGAGYSYTSTELDDGWDKYDVEIDSWILSAGLHTSLNPSTTLHVDIGYAHHSLDVDGSEVDLDYWGVDDSSVVGSIGVRSNVTDRLEINSTIAVVSYDDEETVGLGVGLVYTFQGGFGITLDAGVNEQEDTTLMAGIRYTL